MYLQLIFLCLSFQVFSEATDQSMNELFKDYRSIMEERKVEKLEEVFSKKFIQENGGAKIFSEKIKKFPLKKDPRPIHLSWKAGHRNKNLYFAKLFKDSNSEFIIIEEDNKLKIDGTLSDSE